MTLIRFASTAAPELRESVASGAVALWPIGAIEQHGTHLATGFDLASATAVCERAAHKASGPVVLLPGMPIGSSDHWLDLGATLSLQPDTLRAVLRDVIRSSGRSGFKHLVIVNGHYGNTLPMTEAIANANDVGVEAYAVSYWTLVDQDRLAAACITDEGGIGHAGEIETSIALALDPNLLSHDRLPAPPGRPLRKGGPGGPATTITRLPPSLVEAPNGVHGDPTHARRELGELVLAEAAATLTQHLNQLSRPQALSTPGPR